MAKGNLGGKRSVSSAPRASARSGPVQVAQVQPKMSKTYNDFMDATEDERVDEIEQAMQQAVPSHLSNTDFQKAIYNLDLNDKPDLVDDKTLDSMSGTNLFRTVNSVYDSQSDISYTPTDIAKQIQKGSITRTSDNGGSAYGRGIYFADSYSDSVGYGRAVGDISKTAVVRAKLNQNAKIISYRQALNGASSEISKGTKLGNMLSKADRDSRSSLYALAKGYNVVDNNSGYYVILNRRALTMSKDIRQANRYGQGW